MLLEAPHEPTLPGNLSKALTLPNWEVQLFLQMIRIFQISTWVYSLLTLKPRLLCLTSAETAINDTFIYRVKSCSQSPSASNVIPHAVKLYLTPTLPGLDLHYIGVMTEAGFKPVKRKMCLTVVILAGLKVPVLFSTASGATLRISVLMSVCISWPTHYETTSHRSLHLSINSKLVKAKLLNAFQLRTLLHIISFILFLSFLPVNHCKINLLLGTRTKMCCWAFIGPLDFWQHDPIQYESRATW